MSAVTAVAATKPDNQPMRVSKEKYNVAFRLEEKLIWLHKKPVIELNVSKWCQFITYICLG